MDSNTPQLESIAKDVTQYINLRIDGLKLSLAKGLSVGGGFALTVFIAILLANFALLFFLGAVTYWVGEALGSMALAMLIAGGFYVLLLALVLVFRKRLITNRLVALFCKLFFDNDKKEHHHHKEHGYE